MTPSQRDNKEPFRDQEKRKREQCVEFTQEKHFPLEVLRWGEREWRDREHKQETAQETCSPKSVTGKRKGFQYSQF